MNKMKMNGIDLEDSSLNAKTHRATKLTTIPPFKTCKNDTKSNQLNEMNSNINHKSVESSKLIEPIHIRPNDSGIMSSETKKL